MCTCISYIIKCHLPDVWLPLHVPNWCNHAIISGCRCVKYQMMFCAISPGGLWFFSEVVWFHIVVYGTGGLFWQCHSSCNKLTPSRFVSMYISYVCDKQTFCFCGRDIQDEIWQPLSWWWLGNAAATRNLQPRYWLHRMNWSLASLSYNLCHLGVEIYKYIVFRLTDWLIKQQLLAY